MKANINNIEVGCHITECVYTDCISYTVTKINKRFIEAQKDFQEIDRENWKPEVIPGGFAGHCTNQSSQKWIVSKNPNGGKTRFSIDQKTGNLKSRGYRYFNITLGSHPFYDYNF